MKKQVSMCKLCNMYYKSVENVCVTCNVVISVYMYLAAHNEWFG